MLTSFVEENTRYPEYFHRYNIQAEIEFRIICKLQLLYRPTCIGILQPRWEYIHILCILQHQVEVYGLRCLSKHVWL